jgi:hypothetical protein
MTKASLFTPTDELAAVLGEELAGHFIAHRKALKAPLTAYAAKLMAKKLAAMPNPVASVEQSMLKGWRDCFPVDAPRATFTPTTGIAAVEDQIRREIDDHYRGPASQEGDDSTAVQRFPLLGWQGNDRPH